MYSRGMKDLNGLEFAPCKGHEVTEGCTPLPVGHPPLEGGQEILLILKCFYYRIKF